MSLNYGGTYIGYKCNELMNFLGVFLDRKLRYGEEMTPVKNKRTNKAQKEKEPAIDLEAKLLQHLDASKKFQEPNMSANG